MERKPRILLIDDDPDFVEATKTMLETKPWEVIVAYDGEEGVKKAGEEKPDLILLDIIMPLENGFTAAEQLKKDPQLSKKVKDQTQDLVTPETTTVYKWQDANGQWQVSNQPPPGNTPYETLDYHRDANIMPADNATKTKK